MHGADGEGPFEQAWLLHALVVRFALSQDKLARRFDRSEISVCVCASA